MKDVLYLLSPAPDGWEPDFPDGEIDRAAWVGEGDDPDAFPLSPERKRILSDAAAYLRSRK